MPTINENIAELQQKTTDLITAHTDIKNAIIAKGGTVNDGDKFSDYPEDIATIKNELTSISINENGTYKNGTLDTVTGTEYPIEIVANGEPLVSMTVDGNTVQDGTPTPTAPVDVVGVGIKSKNLFELVDNSATVNTMKTLVDFGTDVTYDTFTCSCVFDNLEAENGYGAFIDYLMDDGTHQYIALQNMLNVNDDTRLPINVKVNGNYYITKQNITFRKIQAYLYTTGYNKFKSGNIKWAFYDSDKKEYEPYGYYLPTTINGGNDINAYFGNYQTTRKIKKLVLTGEETVSIHPTISSWFQIYLDNDIVIDNLELCTHYKPSPFTAATIQNGEILVVKQTSFDTGRIIIRDTTYGTVEDFKTYLQQQYQTGHPVTVWYILATPQTTTSSDPLMKIGDYSDQLTLTDSDIALPTVAGNNSADYDLTLKPSSASISYYKLGVNKTITSDTLPIEFESIGDDATVMLQGQSSQASTPSPQNPVIPNGVGDRTGNLFDITAATSGKYVRDTDGSLGNFDDTSASDYIDVSNITTLYPQYFTEQRPVRQWAAFYDSSKTFVSGFSGYNQPITVPNDATYVRLTVDNNYISNFTVSSTELESYEPYGVKIPISSASTTTPVYLGEVETTRKIKKLVLDGTEHWVYRQGEPSNVFFLETIDVNAVDNHGLCTHYLNQDSGGFDVLQDKHVIIKLSSTGTKWFLGVRDSDFGLPEFKAYLAAQYAAGTPVTIWYVLAESETGVVNEPLMKIGDYVDEVSGISIPTTDGANIIDVDTTVKPSSISITYNDLNTIGYDEINVDVPNTYTVSDEGKVVNNATLVAQTAMPTEITANDTYDTTLYNSIVVNVPTGGSTGTKNDVTFYDYDGTIVTSYDRDEFLALTELPANPSHEGLTAQGWNWSLADAKAYVADNNKLDIGQMYVTDDGNTRLHIRLGESRLKPYLGLTGASSGTAVSIDWGDGSVAESVTLNTSTIYTPHEYSTSGDYTISITVTNGNITLTGDTYTHSNILRKSSTPNGTDDIVYQNSLIGIEIGNNVRYIENCAFNGCYALQSITIPSSVRYIRDYSFYECSSLQSITIPDTVIGISNYAFQYCYSLTSITIPNSVTSIGNYAFNGCYALQSITIPSSVRYIREHSFDRCYSLTSITIPNSVTSIGNYAFLSCRGLGSIKFISTTPPTVANGVDISTDCIMLVPINTFAAYTTATNYPSSSTYTYLVFGTYESGVTLPSSTTDNYMLIWYASIADAIAQTNPITTGNGNEIYARCIVDTSVTRSIDFDNNTSTLSGDPSTHPIYTSIKRCTVQDNGTITSYYGDSNYVEDGSIGQVMVYIPKFYYKVNIINKQLIDDTHPEYGYDIHEASYSVSNIKYPGYKLHPAFINANGDEVDYVLCSAFEGSTYDTSASAYNTNDAQTVDFTASTGDLLASIGYVDNSGTTVHVKPASGLTQNLTRPNSMTIAKNRGTGWYALTFKLTSAIQMLITVEYGCNSQVNIADGVVGITDNTSYNCASYVGSTVGNTTGHAASTINEINGTETTYTSATTTSVNWRGIENMWGNIWKWVDGVNIYGNGSLRGGVPYVCTDMNFDDSKNTGNYESVGFTVANADGYAKYFGYGDEKYDWVFMPSTAGSGGASVSTTVGDYFYKTANLNGYKAARLGGSWTSSSNAGVFCWNLNNAASARYRILGARLMYVPM